ncbi:putative bifunctional diguanylate cyclase/phosphodiesterase [Alcaligenes faecalis]|uniref:putative bifunctional diguanylate cyclase/phosphodiesterase n=1 Tax=Alcaligenes faecalis TaxID=511 RepID=UPI000F0B44DF|nr:EAL domain-containing protein [Alcaligenes faecalis]AYR20134.1 EAL domain-containing protein [Alcaligenes faecalis]
MKSLSSPVSVEEDRRLRLLAEYKLLDTPPTEDFDRLVNLAARLFKVPIALISLIDRDRLFLKARVGTDLCEISRTDSFCANTILSNDILLIPDTLKAPEFASSPLVTSPPYVRFYAGKPLLAPTGERLGTVCLMDTKPRHTFTDDDRANLSDLATLVMARIEAHRLEQTKSDSKARFENIAATSPDAIICSDAHGRITFWNRSAEKIFGYLAHETLNQPGSIIVPDNWRKIYEKELLRLQQGERMKLADRTIELSALRKDGTEFPAEFSLSTWTEAGSTYIGAIVRDITERRHNEERLFQLASLDALTNLANREVLRARLAQTLANETPATILLIELDEFKEINDSLGHSAGDAALKHLSKQIKLLFPNAIMLARFGGDEFMALLPGNDEHAARNAAQTLINVLATPYDFTGQSFETNISVGVVLAPTHGTSAENILSAADLALYKAKSSGKGCYEVFSPTLREVAVARRSFERELRLAFENGEFELFYQPQVSTHTRLLIGAEALIRWNHPTRGLLTPLSFIDVLNEKQSAPAIGEWILQTACRQAARWQATIPDFRIGVNLFEAQLRTNRLLCTISTLLTETGLPASSLELEIVETSLFRNETVTKNLLHGLRDIGVGLAFDDYGTGYASLSLLKTYPVSRLKIDRTFIHHVYDNAENAALVKAIIYLAENFGLDVIAEGVETEEQFIFLKNNECPEVQGYLFGRPVSAETFTAQFIEHKGPLNLSHAK